jgi:uncharacterized membrane protein YphA (DoxX/SURF4 family)
VTGQDRARAVATLGLSIGGPVALFSGIAVGVTLIGGPPVFLVGLFVSSGALALVSLLALTALDARRPRED